VRENLNVKSVKTSCTRCRSRGTEYYFSKAVCGICGAYFKFTTDEEQGRFAAYAYVCVDTVYNMVGGVHLYVKPAFSGKFDGFDNFVGSDQCGALTAGCMSRMRS
jgi:hypothetical protein